MIIKYCNKNPQNDVIQLQRATKPKKNEVQNDYKNHMIAPIMRYWDIWCYKTQIFLIVTEEYVMFIWQLLHWCAYCNYF